MKMTGFKKGEEYVSPEMQVVDLVSSDVLCSSIPEAVGIDNLKEEDEESKFIWY